jgi:Ca2+-binding RTX toxin-like protein
MTEMSLTESQIPGKAIYPEDTVMAYRNPAYGRWPNDYTSNDKAALIELWGRETTPNPTVRPDKPNNLSAQVMDSNLTFFKGTFQADWIIGNDTNNTIKAKGGNDYLQGRLGNDSLMGIKEWTHLEADLVMTLFMGVKAQTSFVVVVVKTFYMAIRDRTHSRIQLMDPLTSSIFNANNNQARNDAKKP